MKLHCDITLPASKSESARALMIAAYGGFAPDFQNLSDSNDTKVLGEALRGLPSMSFLRREVGGLESIEGRPQIIDIADCGTAARFLTTYLACHEGDWLLTGIDRMKQRPMAPLVDALRTLGADIQYIEKEGFLPLRIKGRPIQGGKVSVDMTQSSQFASSLLLAAPMFPQGLELELQGCANSLPYLDMTLGMMCHFYAQAQRQGGKVIVKPKPYEKQPFTIEPDWTAASYWYEMAAFSEECDIRLRGLKAPTVHRYTPSAAHVMPTDEGGRASRGCSSRYDMDGCSSLQGDAVIAEWMQQLGVGTFIENDAIVLRKIPFEKRPLTFDFSQNPDLYPTMAATCAGLNVDATFTGLDNLAIKESDRVEAMQKELEKLSQNPIRFSAHNDHRIVMALAPLSMLVGPVSFDHPEVVEKSYPGFWKDASFLLLQR
jgi:3-phosphoshikimate 1-carboxyvinyltransferase